MQSATEALAKELATKGEGKLLAVVITHMTALGRYANQWRPDLNCQGSRSGEDLRSAGTFTPRHRIQQATGA